MRTFQTAPFNPLLASLFDLRSAVSFHDEQILSAKLLFCKGQWLTGLFPLLS